MKTVICPRCGKPAKTAKTRYGVRNSCCDVWSWGDGQPMFDKFTHHARRSAHDSFDRLWKEKKMTRSAAYKWLSEKLKLPKRRCHIKQFNESQCFDVERLAEKKIRKLKRIG